MTHHRLRISALLAALAVSTPAFAHAPGIDKELPALSEYFRLGIEHILTGYDHLAFLFGLLLLASNVRALLLAITAFTLAHSLSLGLAVMGVVAPPARWVEIIIALSIAYVGVENFFVRDGRARWRITLAFGFVHGFGFAGALQEIGVPAERAPAALALFNLGVEAGQLLVLAVVVPALAWWRARTLVWPRIVLALNAALVLAGAAWAVERGLETEPASTPVVASLQLDVPQRSSQLVSVYPHAPQRSAEAVRLCALFQRLPRERSAACEGSAPGVTLERECARVLSAALGSGALRIDAPAAEGCEREWRARYAGCEFASQPSLPPSQRCEQLWQGQVAAGGACRSALECQAGLTCNGVSPFDAGTCSAPKPEGASCGRSIDVLAAYVPNTASEHRECEGSCVNGRCRANP